MPGKTETGKLSSEERKIILLQRVNSEGRVLANLMAEEFGVSEDSIRRDLRDLSEAGLVQRFHGGAAKLVSAPVEFQRRQTIGPAEKKLIATTAIPLIADNTTLLLDSSTTVLQFVKELPTILNLRIVTSAVDIAAAALDHPNIEVVLIGGRLNRHTRSAVDAAALDAIRTMRADFCVIGACGIDDELAVRADDFEDAYFKGAMIKAASQTILLTTSDKLGKSSAHLVAPISAVSVVVVDHAESIFADRMRDAGVRLLLAG
jgi:DeoR/GlpR family transcriptional regulator of sugar metabolism